MFDLPHTIKTALGWVEAHQQDLREMQQWRQQLDHYRQQLASVAQYLDNGVAMSDRFEERDATWGMGDACPGAAGGIDLWSVVRIDPDGDIPSQQLEICQRIVLARNARYNEQVRVLRRLRDDNAQLRRLSQARAAGGDSQGALAANDNDVARFVARSETGMQYAQLAMVAYDGYIAELERTQAQLAKRALGGDQAGGIVQGIALKAALEAARGRER